MSEPLTPGLVRQARLLAHKKGLTVTEITQQLGMDWQNTYLAIQGSTHRKAGGPLPPHNADAGKCVRCGALTYQTYCRWCREEGRVGEEMSQAASKSRNRYSQILTLEVLQDLYNRFYIG